MLEDEVQMEWGALSSKEKQRNDGYEVRVRFDRRIVPDELAMCPYAKSDDVVL